MRLHRVVLTGISTAFRSSTVTIDFDQMPPGLVALVGENGSGKSTILEATGPLVLYRRSPSYDEAIAERVVPGVHNASVMLAFSMNGHEYQATVRADPMASGGRGKTEATLAEGHALLAGPLVREYDAAILRLLPPEEVFLASAFAAQGGEGSFFAMSRQQRRDVLAVLLGLDRLQRCAEEAAVRGERAGTQFAEQDAKRAIADAAWQESEALRPVVSEAGEKLAAAERDEVEARKVEQHATDRLAVTRADLAAAEALVATPPALPEYDSQVDTARTALESVAQTATRAEGAASAAAQAHAAVVRRLGDIRSRRSRVQMQVTNSDPPEEGVETLRDRLVRTIETQADLRAAAEHAEATYEAGQRVMTERHVDEAAQTRDEQTAALLGKIPGVPECDTCVLTAEARAARDRASQRSKKLAVNFLPEMDALKAALTDAREASMRSVTAKGEIEQAIARAERYTTLVGELGEVDKEHAAAMADGEVAEQELATARAALDDARKASAEARRTYDAAFSARALAIDTAMAAAKARVLDLREAVKVAEQAAQQAAREAAAAQSKARAAAVEHGRIGEKLDAAVGASQHLDALRATVAQHREAVGDWQMTARILGRDGAQALAIDAAGPGISGLANELLTACYGQRFSLRFVTAEPKKSGDGWREVMEVAIYDAEQGRLAKRGSGGEMVVLDEALRLAIALYNVSHHGFECQTLWRDETAGALSPQHAERYVALLRRARVLGGFRHIVFIAHQPEVWSQAESQIHVAEGQVEVRTQA